MPVTARSKKDYDTAGRTGNYDSVEKEPTGGFAAAKSLAAYRKRRKAWYALRAKNYKKSGTHTGS